MRRDVALRDAAAGELAGVRALLALARLPDTAIEREWGTPAWAVLASAAGDLLGVAALETHDGAGLLRSVAVHPDWRGAGLGRLLVEDRLRLARERGLADVWLRTTTAAPFFATLGFTAADETDAPDGLRASDVWREVRCSAAATMRLAPG